MIDKIEIYKQLFEIEKTVGIVDVSQFHNHTDTLHKYKIPNTDNSIHSLIMRCVQKNNLIVPFKR